MFYRQFPSTNCSKINIKCAQKRLKDHKTNISSLSSMKTALGEKVGRRGDFSHTNKNNCEDGANKEPIKAFIIDLKVQIEQTNR